MALAQGSGELIWWPYVVAKYGLTFLVLLIPAWAEAGRVSQGLLGALCVAYAALALAYLGALCGWW